MREQTIQRLQSTLRIFTEGDDTYIQKIATEAGESDIVEQIDLLRHLPPHLACHYPQLIRFDQDTIPSSYTMRYYPWPTLRELVLYSDLDATTLFPVLKEVVRFLFEQQHTWRSQCAPSDYASRTYVHRIWKRLLVLAKEHPMLQNLIYCRQLSVGDEELPGASLLLYQLDALISRCFDSTVCSTHGQMGFSHILVNTKDLEGPAFVLLDAKGRQSLFDPAYDIGKMWECSAGLFDWIEERHFVLGAVSVHQQRVSIETLQFAFPNRQRVCQALHEQLLHELEKYHNQERELTAYRIAAAAHLLGSVDFFYHILGLDCAIVSYVQGVRQLAAIPALVAAIRS